MAEFKDPACAEIILPLVKHAHAFVRMGALRALKELRCKDTLNPALEALLGLAASNEPRQTALLAVDLKANDRREDYLRARLQVGDDQVRRVTPFGKQDSSMLSVLSRSGGLVIRPPHAPAAKAGSEVDLVRLEP